MASLDPFSAARMYLYRTAIRRVLQEARTMPEVLSAIHQVTLQFPIATVRDLSRLRKAKLACLSEAETYLRAQQATIALTE